MFQLTCQTCDEDRIYDEFERCQERFNHHAERGHEVELLRTEETPSSTETQEPDTSIVEE